MDSEDRIISFSSATDRDCRYGGGDASFSIDSKSGILLNFFNAEEECSSRSRKSGNWSNWTGTATAGGGVMTAKLDPTVEKISMAGGDLKSGVYPA